MKDFTCLEPIDYLVIPWKRRWYFLGSMALVIGGVAIYAWLTPPLYKSEAKIVVETNSLVDEIQGSPDKKYRSEERINSVRNLIESRTFLERLVDEFQLQRTETALPGRGGTILPMEEALDRMRKNLIVTKTSTNTFTLTFYARRPQAARAVVQRAAEVLIQTNQASQKDHAMEKDQFLETELKQATADLGAVDEEISQFKSAHLGALPEQAAANMNALNGLQTQLIAIENSLDRAKDQQKLLEFRLEEQKRMGAIASNISTRNTPPAGTVVPKPAKEPPSPLEAQITLKKAQLNEMTARYTSKHPDVVRLAREVEELEAQLKANAAKSAAADSKSSSDLTSLGQAETPAGENQPGESQAARVPSQIELASESAIAQTKYEMESIAQSNERKEKDAEEIRKRIAVYQERLNLAPGLEQELMTLTRKREVKRDLVAELQTRKFNSQMTANAVTDKNSEIFKMLDDANLPERPSFPNYLKLTLIAIVGGLAAGLSGAFGREFLEPSLSSEAEVAAVLKLPVLVSIPEIPSHGPTALLE